MTTPPPHDTRFEELLPSYALGATDGEELAELRAHLATGCVRCHALLAGWRADVESLLDASEPLVPSAVTRQRVLSAVAAQPRGAAAATPGPSRRPALAAAGKWGWLAAAAALLLAIWAGGSRLALRERLEQVAQERDSLATEARLAREEVAAAQQAIARLVRESSVLASPGLATTVLAGLPGAPQATGKAFVNPNQGTAVFHAFGLPPAPHGHTYQLWFIAAGKPVPAGVFDPDARGHGSVLVENVVPPNEIQAWAVTIEPAGGVPQPTGEMVLKG